ncbi:hypothetical protein Pan181_14780 [Aeoliella mucimassa]|uniref:Uncharacterized protein n=1 Tax=Aeoliella mucimassa TaxID=2527972 RepID=A0A518AKN8_9BACT|nr:hypothetical protein Pan181_14780 [Aeoliella mucimassa]
MLWQNRQGSIRLRYETNRPQAIELTTFLGVPAYSTGAVSDLDIAEHSVSVFVASTRDDRFAGWAIENALRQADSVWIYQQVPEPSSFALSAFAILAACFVGRTIKGAS